MKGKLQKISANKDRQDSIQFRIDAEEMAKESTQEQFLSMRRYDHIKVFAEGQQSLMADTGEIIQPKLEFQATNTSISICPLEDGWIVTLTFSFDDLSVFETVVRNQLRNAMVNLEFEEGENPFTK